MAINFKDYSKTKHTGVSVHKDGLRYLLVIKINGKLYRKSFKANPIHGKSDRLKSAYNARESFLQAKTHELNITADTNATVNTYWNALLETKTSKWSDAQREKNIGYYDNYIRKEQELANKLSNLEHIKLNDNFDYHLLKSLSYEAREKLSKIRPKNIGQASRISGVSPADISVLLVYLGR